MPDKTLSCRDCGVSFTFTTAEQDFFAGKGFTNEPGRCSDCRRANKANRENGSGGYVRREREMFPAVCAQCGKDTQVPFQPRGDRPVYCSSCFEGQRGQSGGDRATGGNSRNYLSDLLRSLEYRSN